MTRNDIIIQRFCNLEKIKDIAKDYNVTSQAICWVIHRYLDKRTIKSVWKKRKKITAKKHFNI